MAKKQFVWIMTDTTGYNMVGCYGSQCRTPRIDDMAREGLRFERVYTCQPVCGPARSALFTGQYPHSNGSWGNCMALSADALTLGQRLTKQGIACGYIGKWHLDGGDYFGNGVCPDGWEEKYWYDMKCYLDELTEEERRVSRDERTSDKGIDASFTYGYRVTQRALAFLEEHKDDDFFLVVSYDEPHDPSLCPEPYASMYRDRIDPSPAWDDDLRDKPECLRVWAQTKGEADPAKRSRGILPRIAACNSFIDGEIGRVLDAARSLTPGSLRLFTSDHGDAAHAHGLVGKGPCVFDEVARVPLLFEGPQVPKGKVYRHAVSHIDLAATVLDHMGLPRPVMLQGESLLPQLRDPEKATGRPVHVEFGRYEIDHDGFGGFQPMRAVITDEYKLALHLLDGDEMYDVKRDPYDLVNVIEDPAYAAARDALHDDVLEWMNVTRDPFRGYQWKCRPWRGGVKKTWDVDGYTRQRDNDPGEYRQKDYATGCTMEQATRQK